ncbi:hypothetical protein KCP70_11665 [Salmonella enterica subsp. enterica]|nr:hypothetical protein KCP70_11665 [Salmonella enterica subsp. enterica]
MELFGERLWRHGSHPPLFFAVSFYYWPISATPRRHPTPLISLSLFKTRTFSVGIAGNLATRLGTGCTFLMPLMLQVGFATWLF